MAFLGLGLADRHQTMPPIAEPRTADQKILALFRGLKSGDATGAWVSPTSE